MIESVGRAANCLRFCVLAPWRRLLDIEAETRGRGVLNVSVRHLGCLLFGSALSFWYQSRFDLVRFSRSCEGPGVMVVAETCP